MELGEIRKLAADCAARLEAIVTVVVDSKGELLIQEGDPRSLPHAGLWNKFFGSKEAISSLRKQLQKSLLPQTFSQGELILGLTFRHNLLFGFFFRNNGDFFVHVAELEECDRLVAEAI
ncbi:MAG: hypothetical protein H7A21_15275 [Spirochaetales bacterium]|nr:hypothetical protein [Leptospiraceae bacterium]MCP5482796.1 hypothetical protein [Spirochaetales bacterium]